MRSSVWLRDARSAPSPRRAEEAPAAAVRCMTCVRKAASEISAELHLVQQAEGERKGERSPSQQLKQTLKMHLSLQLEHAAIHTGCMTLHQQKWFLLSVAYSEDDLDLVNNPSLMFKHQVLQLN